MRTEILKAIILGKTKKEILNALVDSGLSTSDAEAAFKDAKDSLKGHKIPTRKELSVLTCAMLSDATEAGQFGIAQKLLNDLCKIARIDHSLEFKLPKFENSEQYLTALLENLDSISPAMLGNLSRFMATVRDCAKPLEDEKDVAENTAEPTNADEACERVLRLIKSE